MDQRPDGDLQLAGYPLVKYKDWTLPRFPWFQKDAGKQLQRIKEFKSRDNDILLCTPVKTGYHWVHEIMCMLVDQTTQYNSRLASFNVHLDFQDNYSNVELETSRRILHSNLPFSCLPTEHIRRRAKIVFVNRNPKDRHASFYNFLKGKNGVPPTYTWDDYFEEFVLNDKLYGGWFNYTKEIVTAMQDKSNNVHLVMFEDLKINLKEEIKRLAVFLEVPFDNAIIQDIADKCTFDQLKRHKIDGTKALDPEFTSTLFRKGKIGDWKNWFTVAQNEQFEALYQHEMKGVNIKFTFM